jgi:hypothetical protein
VGTFAKDVNVKLWRVSGLELIVDPIKFPPKSVFGRSIQHFCPDPWNSRRPVINQNEVNLVDKNFLQSQINKKPNQQSRASKNVKTYRRGLCFLCTACFPISLLKGYPKLHSPLSSLYAIKKNIVLIFCWKIWNYTLLLIDATPELFPIVPGAWYFRLQI